MKIRCSSHKLAIETGRMLGIEREERICRDCNLNVVGDEYHFLIECQKHNEIRQSFISDFYVRNKSVFHFCKLLMGNKKILLNLAKFIKCGKGV